MSTYETPLILFTVLTQLAVGLVFFSAVRQYAGPSGETGKIRAEWMTAAAALLIGLVASVFHLGHPAGMVRALSNLGTAWLSREALTVGVFFALMAAGTVIIKDKANPGFALLTGLIGLLVVLAMGFTYAPPSYPAVNNVLPFAFFAITAALLGSSLGAVFAPAGKRPLMTRILTTSLVVGLVVYLIVPCVWLSGGEVLQMTGQAWLSSPLYWGRIIVGLALPLVVIGAMKDTPSWLWALVLAGELMGRAVFFASTVHSAVNMGGIY